MKSFIPFLFLFLFALLCTESYSLTTAYVTFDHPEGWRCELSQGVWICQSSNESDKREAVVMSIAILATEWDNVENYEKYLKQPKTIQDEEGNPLNTKIAYVTKKNINGVTWVDSLQFNAELPGFWTRYLATVYQANQTKLGILITYIVSDEKYTQLAPIFQRMVASLKPNAEFDLNIASKQGDAPLPGSTIIGPLQKEIINSRLDLKTKKPENKKPTPQGEGSNYALYGVGVAAILGIIILRRRRKKKTPQEPSQMNEPPFSANG